MVEYVKIPEERIKTLLKEEAKLVKDLEKRTNTKIEVDSSLSEVTILETDAMEDPLATWVVRDIIKAIGRGFDPEIALGLLDQEKVFELINLMDFAKSKNDLIRIRSRIIGTEGRAKQTIEDLTGTHISVYGKTVAVIGLNDDVEAASRAIEKIAQGSSHGGVFKILEDHQRKRQETY